MNEPIPHFIALAISGIVVTLCLALHYEALRFPGRMLGKYTHKRTGVLLVMLGGCPRIGIVARRSEMAF